MSASYPSSIVSFPTHNTTDTIQASDVNNPNAEIVAVETGLLNGFQHNLFPLADLGQTLGVNANRWAFPTGTAAAPTINFGDTGTGFYRNGANNVSLAQAGTQAFTWNANGFQAQAGFDIFTTQWTDYAATSTIVGWTSFTTKHIYYKQVGSLVIVTFNLQGTSNASSVSFTLPVTSNATNPQLNFPFMGEDNGSQIANVPMAQLAAGSTTVNCYTNIAGGGWTNSGTKIAMGQFFFQI